MKKVKFGDITVNLDNIRKPLNGIDRKKISKRKLYPYCGANNIMDYVDEYLFDEEILCIAEDGGKWGKNDVCSYIMNEKCWVNNHAHVVKTNNRVDIRYLRYWLNYNDLNPIITGAIVRKLTKKALNNIEIILPDKIFQRKVANELDKIQEIINIRKKQIEELDRLIKSQFIEMFGTIYDNKYEIKQLKDIFELIKDGTHNTPTYINDSINGIKFLSAKDVTTGKINWKNVRYIPIELHNELIKRVRPQKDDILLAKNGTTGICAKVEKDELFDIYVSLALLRPKSGYSVDYLVQAINNDITKEQFDRSLKGVGVPNLHLGEIEKAKIVVPPIELQRQFAERAQQVDKQKSEIQKSLEEMEKLKESLMNKYFG